ncbi:MAG: membrane protein insertase YidC [Acidobacteria bacterium]|nr:MAG: membrane protein insertase YidC [Acidobacteriota bacterium]REJ99606.1 MAG: membrane protein insertase YidC [Acidobacteriota bacterium]
MESRRFLIAAVLSLAVLVLWQWVFPPAPPVDLEGVAVDGVASPAGDAASERSPQGAARAGRETGSPDPGSTPEATGELVGGESQEEPTRPVEPVSASAEEEVTLATERWEARFSNRGAVLTSFVLKARLGADGEPLQLVRQRQPGDPSPFALVDDSGEALAVADALFVAERGTESVTFRFADASGAVEKIFSVERRGDGDFLAVEVQSSLPGWNLWLGPGLRNPTWSELDDRFQKRDRNVTYLVGEEAQRVVADKIKAAERIDTAAVAWLSLQDKYFLSAVLPRAGLRSANVVPVAIEGGEDLGLTGYQAVATTEGESRPIDLGVILEPERERLELSTYWGAKQYVELRRLGSGLEKAVQWGRLGFIARPLLYGLRWLHDNVTTNYGWCIVLMTLLLRIALLPLTHTSFVSMQKMQQLNPKMEAIRARYRPKLKDKQGRPNFEQQRKMNEEIQALFKQEKVNPAAGCLPLLLQMPIFFAFYQLLVQAVELWGAPWILWINDLSSRDPIWVLPLVMGGTQYLQQKLMPASPNPTQRMIMNTMPVFFTVFALNFPSGLVLYWLTNNVLTIFQQAGYNRLKKAGLFGGEQPSEAKEKR